MCTCIFFYPIVLFATGVAMNTNLLDCIASVVCIVTVHVTVYGAAEDKTAIE